MHKATHRARDHNKLVLFGVAVGRVLESADGTGRREQEAGISLGRAGIGQGRAGIGQGRGRCWSGQGQTGTGMSGGASSGLYARTSSASLPIILL